MSCHVMSCHVMSCHVMSCHVMLCYVMLCYVMLYITNLTLFVLLSESDSYACCISPSPSFSLISIFYFSIPSIACLWWLDQGFVFIASILCGGLSFDSLEPGQHYYAPQGKKSSCPPYLPSSSLTLPFSLPLTLPPSLLPSLLPSLPLILPPFLSFLHAHSLPHTRLPLSSSLFFSFIYPDLCML